MPALRGGRALLRWRAAGLLGGCWGWGLSVLHPPSAAATVTGPDAHTLPPPLSSYDEFGRPRKAMSAADREARERAALERLHQGGGGGGGRDRSRSPPRR